ncbi:MAG: primosomal protein N' [Lachnospiraceae bacterium]|nr:primosomal protein N' [Lachnospiraceae bacterium]
MNRFASVIIDIAAEKLDRPFTYLIPPDLSDVLEEGMEVTVPFGAGNKERKAYVVALTDHCDYPLDRLKSILRINERSVGLEGRALELAVWMKKHYGGSLITSMQTVLPVKKKMKERRYRTILRLADPERLSEEIKKLNPMRFAARIRLYEALMTAEEIPEGMAKEKLGISASVFKTAEKDGLIRIEESRLYRAPKAAAGGKTDVSLSGEQQAVADDIREKLREGDRKPVLLCGITGSGKTEIYMELIADALKEGKQAVVLIPEISLTFQTLMRFYARFGDRVSVMHSRLSDGERYDQYERVRDGKLDIIIGARSALFMPFHRLGIIVIDEEHEGSYKNERMPKYHAREVAEHLAGRDDALLLLGSATPSVESYYRSQQGEYRLYKLKSRFGNAQLPSVHVVDLREELKNGNRSIFSEKLKQLLTERIVRGEQSMLFINRRGLAGFVSCRSCGYVAGCPHCSVSLTEHRDGLLHCHYCGHTEASPKVCPKCGSRYIGGFRAGTEQVEEELSKLYPSVRILRMDADTTKNKDDYDRILSAFADGEAEILVGTQMIVKGHDFPNVTLVGALAADLSLFSQDYHAAERTFQLLTQAAGRAGRGSKAGEVVIQTYRPEHYSVRLAALQDYEAFYEEEIGYRELADYPPVSHLMNLQFFSKTEGAGMKRAEKIAEGLRSLPEEERPEIMGPAEALIGKLKDVYRTGLYLRDRRRGVLDKARELAERLQEAESAEAGAAEVVLQFDPDPMNSF